jgi:adenylate kinase family enzyme
VAVYAERGVLVSVDAVGSVEAVTDRIHEAMSARIHRAEG